MGLFRIAEHLNLQHLKKVRQQETVLRMMRLQEVRNLLVDRPEPQMGIAVRQLSKRVHNQDLPQVAAPRNPGLVQSIRIRESDKLVRN